ncbi:MAG: hypothetical protein R3C56_28010 [Pirellulaceae bacterium]
MLASNSASSLPPMDQNNRSTEFQQLLSEARSGNMSALGRLLEWYVNYLTILATTGLDRRIQRRVSPSDLVQEAMLAAHRDFGDFRGQSQGSFVLAASDSDQHATPHRGPPRQSGQARHPS